MIYPFPVRAALVLAMAASSQAATLVPVINTEPSGGSPSGSFVLTESATTVEQESLESVPEPHTLPFGVLGMALLLLRRRSS